MILLLWLFGLLPQTQPDPQVEKAAAPHIARLGHSRYAVREAASKALCAMGSDVKPILASIRSKDHEVVVRAQAVVRQIVEAEVRSLAPMPFLDALWFDTRSKTYLPIVQWAELDHYLERAGRTSRPWHGYRRATELWVREMLAAGRTPSDLRPLLALMHYRDSVWISTSPPWLGEQDPPVIVDAFAYLQGH